MTTAAVPRHLIACNGCPDATLDLCASCAISGRWNKSRGPFKVQIKPPAVARAFRAVQGGPGRRAPVPVDEVPGHEFLQIVPRLGQLHDDDEYQHHGYNSDDAHDDSGAEEDNGYEHDDDDDHHGFNEDSDDDDE
ncbi:hypothetical protein SPRG_16858 [Saprolegnia parasitica CBS 223.65]|uniref:Uncharacterized protein n=1 Tax=Saprolegnia parasitica (strain CBS 223.65) TaxID=695850 RepID=A0A067BLM5_SAPPC|nr:hypothetical protein SPRG_16858 [Saprolegnia parasitica CBS 223.65]KDO17620.1 hypothetical protein SPRG_16858 [Saprolegnia parasitica CBS 223.65]|eukprot:XP_012211670.1 hypothetical protein SPRG_16858 [Saprolegnia parasitica CBS 223.65]